MALLDSEILEILLNNFQFYKEIESLFAIKRIARLAAKHSLIDNLECTLKSINLVEELVVAVLTSVCTLKKPDPSHAIAIEILVYLMENSTELFLKDLFLENVSKVDIVDKLVTILNMAQSYFPEGNDRQILLSSLYQIFQVVTEIREIALSVLTNSLYRQLIDLPKTKAVKSVPIDTKENFMVYLDKMAILINLFQYSDEIKDLQVQDVFNKKVQEFFSIERFMVLKEQLINQKKTTFIERLQNSKSEILNEIKDKKAKKQKKELEHSMKNEWLDIVDTEKHVFVVLARLYESVINLVTKGIRKSSQCN